MASATKRHNALKKDRDYIAWLHEKPCCVCGSEYAVQTHHAIRRSQGGQDKDCVPLCFDHHLGKYGIHIMGVDTWTKKFKLDLVALSEQYYAEYCESQVEKPKEKKPASLSGFLSSLKSK